MQVCVGVCVKEDNKPEYKRDISIKPSYNRVTRNYSPTRVHIYIQPSTIPAHTV